MKVLLVVLALIALVAAATEKQYQVEFTTWMQRNTKVYAHDEFQARYQVFKSNYDFVHNFDSSIGFTVELNKFADLTAAEFASIYNGFRMPETIPLAKIATKNDNVGQMPETFDWRTKGAVTPVKNQGQCGSCWSFSATGSTEGAWFLKTGNLVSLSEQNLVDCSQAEGNMGCNGGLMDYAFQYIISHHGIDTEASYPYTAKDGTCKFNPANIGATIVAFSDVPSGSESSLQTFTYAAPTSVAIDASHSSFQLYAGGVYYEPACSSTQLDHGVLSIGWGTSSGSAYWLVKNSWGADWGMSGFIMMSRNRSNNCGIATVASRPTE